MVTLGLRESLTAQRNAVGKTCDAMRSCIAASRGAASLRSPLVACAEPLFCTLRNPTWSLGLSRKAVLRVNDDGSVSEYCDGSPYEWLGFPSQRGAHPTLAKPGLSYTGLL